MNKTYLYDVKLIEIGTVETEGKTMWRDITFRQADGTITTVTCYGAGLGSLVLGTDGNGYEIKEVRSEEVM